MFPRRQRSAPGHSAETPQGNGGTPGKGHRGHPCSPVGVPLPTPTSGVPLDIRQPRTALEGRARDGAEGGRALSLGRGRSHF